MRASAREERAARRDLLIDAAAEILREEGVAGCTARAIAARAGLSKSAIHYYLEDIEDLVERGFRRLMDDFIDIMQRRAAAVNPPSDRVWAAAAFYLRVGLSRDGRVPMMTFEVLVNGVRQNRLESSAYVTERITELFRDLVDQTGCDDAARRGDVFVSALMGTLIRDQMFPRPVDETFAELAAIIGIPPPSRSASELDPRPDRSGTSAYSTSRFGRGSTEEPATEA